MNLFFSQVYNLVITEDVDQEILLHMLRQFGCHQIQGGYFCPAKTV